MLLKPTIWLLFFVQIQQSLENKCEKELHSLASKQKDFVFCATVHSVPVKLCIGCEDQYTDMTIEYDLLRNDSNCSAIFFDKDRINIVATTQSILTGLWVKAFCDDCFNGNHSSVFDDKLKALEDCLNLNKNQECYACLNDYLDLNSFYTNLNEKNNGKICYDMQDSMNRTRSHWSKDLRCCHRSFNMAFFLLASGIVGILPVVFYFGMYAWTKRSERSHGILVNEDTESNNTTAVVPPRVVDPARRVEATIIAPVANVAPRAIVPNAPVENNRPAKKILANDDDDSSSDEEQLQQAAKDPAKDNRPSKETVAIDDDEEQLQHEIKKPAAEDNRPVKKILAIEDDESSDDEEQLQYAAKKL